MVHPEYLSLVEVSIADSFYVKLLTVSFFTKTGLGTLIIISVISDFWVIQGFFQGPLKAVFNSNN